MVRFLVSLNAIVLLPSAADAAVGPKAKCRVVTVNESQNWMEEGLGKFGDRSVDSDSQEFFYTKKSNRLHEVRLGKTTFSSASDDVVKMSMQGTVQVFKIEPADMDLKMTVKIYTSMRGIVLQSEAGREEAVLASLDCMPIKKVVTAKLNSRGVRKLTNAEIRAIPRLVFKGIATVDVAAELGDDYYDVQSSDLYEVLEDNTNSLLGYIDVVDLTYSEGDPLRAVVRFDRNGLRLGDIETSRID